MNFFDIGVIFTPIVFKFSVKKVWGPRRPMGMSFDIP